MLRSHSFQSVQNSVKSDYCWLEWMPKPRPGFGLHESVLREWDVDNQDVTKKKLQLDPGNNYVRFTTASQSC